MIVTAARASAILYSVLRVRRDSRPILLPANVCVDVPLTFLHAGSAVEFLDIEEPSLTLDRHECLRRVRAAPERYGGVLFVHPYGAETDPEPLFHELRQLNPELLLVDDRCLCPPDPEARRSSGSADMVLWSTGPRKSLDLGGGGFARLAESCRYVSSCAPFDAAARRELEQAAHAAVATRRRFAGVCDRWLDLGPAPWPWHEYRDRMRRELPLAAERRRLRNEIYSQEIAAAVQLPRAFQNWRFNIRLPDPDRLLRRFAESALFAGRHYASLGGVFGPDRCPRAEQLHASIVNLFNDDNFDESRTLLAAHLVSEHLRSYA